MRRLVFLALTLATGCSDALEQSTTAGQVVAVVSRDGSALTLVSAHDFTSSDVTLVVSLGADPRIASRDAVLLITSTSSSTVYMVDLAQRPYHITASFSGPPPSSPASSVAIQDDSIAWITSGNVLERLNYLTGVSSTLTVGSGNTAVALTAGRVFVLSGNRTGIPLPPSYISVVSPTTLTVEDSIPLSGTGASHMTLGDDSLLYVVNSGLLSDSAGKLSIVDPLAQTEVVVINGLGGGAGPAVFHPSGRLLIGSVVKGILEVSTLTRTLTRGPGNPITDGGQAITGLAIDEARRVYAVDPDTCAVTVLTPPDYHNAQTPVVGGCPYSAAAATVP
jgi:hypothetical protein